MPGTRMLVFLGAIFVAGASAQQTSPGSAQDATNAHCIAPGFEFAERGLPLLALVPTKMD